MRTFLLSLLALSFSVALLAQPKKQKTPIADQNAPIELISAGELEMMMVQGIEARYLRSKDSILVIFKQGDMQFTCDEAIQFPDSNFVVAIGHIFVERGDSIQASGDTLLYDGNTRFAELRSNVYFTDKEVELRSPYVNYYLNQDLATYQYGAVITDREATLRSRRGYYYTEQKLLAFKRNVVLDNPKANYHIETDTMTYYTDRKVANFHAQTFITSKDGKIEAMEGEYYTEEGRSQFRKRVTVENDTYIISSDNLDYRELAGAGEASGKVKMFTKEDSLTIYGDYSKFDEETEALTVLGQVLLEKPFGKDTLFLAADTLISLKDTIGAQTLLAYPRVKIYTSSMEGVCDSLVYNTTDSLIKFFKKPVLWANNSQLTADTLIAVMSNDNIDLLKMRKNAFIISKDSIGQFDQIKGRDMLATFRESYLHQVDVNGNGQSIYFALEKDTVLMGMNRVDCGNMVMRFDGQNDLKNITFIKSPDAKFIPPHELSSSVVKLPDFKWRIEERQGRSFITNHPYWEAPKPAPKALQRIDDAIGQGREGIDLDPKINIENLDTAMLSVKYGQLINAKHLLVYLKNGVITFVHSGKGGGQFNSSYYADIIPKDLADLSPANKKLRYEQRTGRPSATELIQKPFVFQIKLPSYPIYTLRFGQFSLDRNDKPKYEWTEAYNMP